MEVNIGKWTSAVIRLTLGRPVPPFELTSLFQPHTSFRFSRKCSTHWHLVYKLAAIILNTTKQEQRSFMLELYTSIFLSSTAKLGVKEDD